MNKGIARHFTSTLTALTIIFGPLWSVVAKAPKAIVLPINTTFITPETAAFNPLPAPLKPVQGQPPQTMRIDADSLRVALLESNLSIEEEFKNLEIAKATVNLNRDKLFPSINLEFSASFVMKAVSFLLPFLMPSNWYNLKQSKYLLESEKKSYALLQYNAYASAYATYVETVGDYRLMQTAYDSAITFDEIVQYMAKKVEIGMASQKDLDQAMANSDLANDAKTRLQDKLNQDVASLRQVLYADLDQPLEFVIDRVPASPDEDIKRTEAAVLKDALARSLEYQQADDLINAAKAGAKAAAWSWFGGVTLAAQNGAKNSAAFTQMKPIGTISFGLDIFDTINIANLNTDIVGIRKKQIESEQQLLVTDIVEGVRNAASSEADQESSEVHFKNEYEANKKDFADGFTNAYFLNQAAITWTAQRLNAIQAETSLDLQRISLHRLMLTDQFSKIKGCANNDVSKKKQTTLEEMCTPPAKK